MRRILFFGSFIWTLMAVPLVHAETGTLVIHNPNDVIRGVVKIMKDSADPFTAKTTDSHGTGFFVERRGGKGYIFTNRHVVEKSDPHEVQSFSLAIATDTRMAEKIPARVAFVSNLNDFAVLEFDLNDVKRAKDTFKPFKLPTPKSEWYDVEGNFRSLQVSPVYAAGNPFDSENVITLGVFTGLKHDKSEATMIQTDAAINEGNSGGPLIAVDTGEVVGINTAIYKNANSVGFAIPIGLVLKEWKLAKANPKYLRSRSGMVLFNHVAMGKLQLMGWDRLIRDQYPDYFDHFDSALIVESALESSALKRGDLILSANHQVVGDSIYGFRVIRQQNVGDLQVRVIRDGQVKDLIVPEVDLAFQILRSAVDFVDISGFFFREVNVMEAWFTSGTPDMRVVLTNVRDTPDTNFGRDPLPDAGSFVEAVSFGGPEIRIRSLFDLKMALKANPNSKSIRLVVHEAITVLTTDSQFVPVRQPNGAPVLSSVTTSFVLPISEVVTPSVFSLHRFRRQFSFASDGFDTRQWRDHLREASENCAARLRRRSP